ncbi:sortase family protein [Actinotignum sanguinis]|uniref:hypothetical protein n=1 Tax=Actinotignum sanguinis TaxID=1445614 RepID=UPI00293526C8|nr:hypothetical protein [Actinotignum sanguinis]
MKKNLLLPYLIGLLVILGLTLLVYPHAAAWLSQYEQSKVTGAYSEQIATAQPDKDTQLAAAHAYNEAFNAGAVLEANERKATGTGDTTAADGIWPYEKILAADSEGLMARLRIPTIDVDLPVYHGTSDEVLNRAAGHLRRHLTTRGRAQHPRRYHRAPRPRERPHVHRPQQSQCGGYLHH